jgi:chromosome segregation ATPase
MPAKCPSRLEFSPAPSPPNFVAELGHHGAHAMRRLPNILVCLALGLPLPGCQTKTGECNKLADIVNEGVAQIGKIENQISEDPAQLAKDADEVADLAEKTATAVGALTIETAELRPRAETYEAVAKDMAEVSREFAGLMKQAEELQGSRLETAEAKFTESQTALESVCDGGPQDCAKLAEVLERQPENPSEEELGTVLGTYITDLRAVDLADAAVKKAVDAHLAAVEAYKKVIDEWAKLQTDLDATEQKLDAVVAREDTIVADLNSYCVGSAS